MIIVGLTTIPERLKKGVIKKCIKSIVNQTIPVDYIVVNIPEVSSKGVKYDYHAAHELVKLDKKIIIRWGINDEGPITKLFGTLDFIKSKGIIDGKIVLVDDDVEYHKLAIEYLISQNYPAVGFVGRQSSVNIVTNKVKDLIFRNEHSSRIEGIDFIETFASVCYDLNSFNIYNIIQACAKLLPRYSLDGSKSLNNIVINNVEELIYRDVHIGKIENIDFLETFALVCYDINLFNINDMRTWIKQLPPDAFYVDDIVIGAWLWKNNVTPYIITICKKLKLYSHDAEGTTQLSDNNLNYRNIKVFSELYSLGYFKRKPHFNFVWFQLNYGKIIFIFLILLILFYINKK
jgi:hypothetical protein